VAFEAAGHGENVSLTRRGRFLAGGVTAELMTITTA
jgi:hypothetical protein